ncbi:hypothetical protein C7S18_04765 [Ahniella affigens]|uniref:Uncharacterized protein n=1 Tax=Ahniella affigens TaxID=2021234 RepID=A0A2P1PNY6_9GAMM|nr:hypothetical protein [Ahniella affigens]AVP96553.1 hypothetical protein C7S18_04765 [Ahniella affigens]
MRTESPPFDDVLGLASLPLGRNRGVVFCGRSGAGKSSAIRFMIERHAAFRETRADLDVIEELYDLRDLPRFIDAMRHARPLLIASHWPIRLHRLLAPLCRMMVIDLDQPQEKIRQALRRKRVDFSDHAVSSFCKAFGANYTDLALVIERYPDLSFDYAWRRFQRECSVRESKPS